MRRPTRLAVDVLLRLYSRAYWQLWSELSAELLRVKGTSGRARFLAQRLGAIEEAVERYRSGIDPETGEVFLEGPGWQGLVGPQGTNGLSAEIAHQAYASGMALDEALIEAQGMAPPPPLASLHSQAATLLAEELTEKTDDLLTGIIRRTRDVFREIQTETTIAEMTKGEDIRALTARLVEEFEAKGLKAFPTRRLKSDGTPVEWSLDAYARMLARTVANKAAQQAADNRAAEMGIDLVVIVGGIGDTTCDTCRKALTPPKGADPKTWKPVYSRSGKSKKYPPLSRLLKAKPPIFHPYCGHVGEAYVERPTAAGPTPEELQATAERVAKKLGIVSLLTEEA